MKVPIACRLDEAGARSQLGEWHDLVATAVVATHRVSPTQLSLRLGDDLAQLDDIVRLAQREKACCPFFDFTLQIEADAAFLLVAVPEDAAVLLDGWA